MPDPKTRCLIVDDEPLAIQVLLAHAGKVSDLDVVETCSSALAAFEALRRHAIDLVFLDIQMPELTGIELVRSLENPPAVIFTTAHRDFAVEGFELDVVDYLLKPVSLPRFLRAVDKYRRLRAPATPHGADPTPALLTVRADRQTVQIPLDAIRFIESLSDYTKIHTAAKPVVTREKISELERRLEPHGFVRIHRSFIVPLQGIVAFTADRVDIGGQILPIGRSYRHAARARLNP
ncbi:MAG: response regulator transcription factor [Rhodothermales bacterium]